MFLNLLKFISPLLHKIVCLFKGLNPDAVSYYLYQSNINSNHYFKIFLFTSKYKYRRDNDLKHILNIVLDIIEDHYFKYNYDFTITFYESDKYGFLREISNPCTFTLHSLLTVNTLYNKIKWRNLNNNILTNDIIVIIHINYPI